MLALTIGGALGYLCLGLFLIVISREVAKQYTDKYDWFLDDEMLTFITIFIGSLIAIPVFGYVFGYLVKLLLSIEIF